MPYAMQAATMPHDAVDWRTVATLAIGAYLGLKTWIDNLRESARIREAERRDAVEKELRDKLDSHSVVIAKVVAQIGLEDGGGLTQQFDQLLQEVKGLRKEVHDAMVTFAKGAK